MSSLAKSMQNGKEQSVQFAIPQRPYQKLQFPLLEENFSHRSFASAVPLELFALHATAMNQAPTFKFMRAYRGLYRYAAGGYDSDDPPNVLHPSVRQCLLTIGGALAESKW